jgi:hypothetical protein
MLSTNHESLTIQFSPFSLGSNALNKTFASRTDRGREFVWCILKSVHPSTLRAMCIKTHVSW